MSTPMPESTRHDLQDMLDGWNDMLARTAAAEERAKNADLLNIQLMTERDFYKEQFTVSDAERKRVTEYARDLTTRLEVIEDLIRTTRSEARSFAMRPMAIAPLDDDPQTQAMAEKLAPMRWKLPDTGLQKSHAALDNYLAGNGDLKPRPAASGL